MATESLRTVRDGFSEYVDRVCKHQERIFITRNGTPAAVLISPQDLESLEETLAILSDPEEMQAIAEGMQALERGDVVRGVEAVKALRSQRP